MTRLVSAGLVLLALSVAASGAAQSSFATKPFTFAVHVPQAGHSELVAIKVTAAGPTVTGNPFHIAVTNAAKLASSIRAAYDVVTTARNSWLVWIAVESVKAPRPGYTPGQFKPDSNMKGTIVASGVEHGEKYTITQYAVNYRVKQFADSYCVSWPGEHGGSPATGGGVLGPLVARGSTAGQIFADAAHCGAATTPPTPAAKLTCTGQDSYGVYAVRASAANHPVSGGLTAGAIAFFCSNPAGIVVSGLTIEAPGHTFAGAQTGVKGDRCGAAGDTLTCTLDPQDSANHQFSASIGLIYSDSDSVATNPKGSCGIVLSYELTKSGATVASGTATQTQAGGGCG